MKANVCDESPSAGVSTKISAFRIGQLRVGSCERLHLDRIFRTCGRIVETQRRLVGLGFGTKLRRVSRSVAFGHHILISGGLIDSVPLDAERRRGVLADGYDGFGYRRNDRIFHIVAVAADEGRQQRN